MCTVVQGRFDQQTIRTNKREGRVWNAGILRKLNFYAKNFRFFESELGTFVFYEKVYLCHATAGN